jgi:hypothetical protein
LPDFDAGFKIVAHHAGQRAALVGGVRSDTWEPIRSEVQTAERFADKAFRAGLGRERFLVYMEAYTRWQAAAPWSVLAKSGLLSERERLPTVSLIYVLLPAGYRSQRGRFRLAVNEKPTQHIWFKEVCLWERRPTVDWEESPALLALNPLCRHGKPERQAIRIRRTSSRTASPTRRFARNS